MAETTSSAVAKRAAGPAMIQQYRSEFTGVLPGHIDQDSWVRLAQALVRKDKNLSRIAQTEAGSASLMRALRECARLGHEPGTDSFYLVPIGNEIEGWEGYKGVIERMYRAGAVTSVKAELVKTNDVFEYSPDMARPIHKVDWFGDRGATLGAYAFAEMVGGATSKVVVIAQDYIDKVRAMSKGSNNAHSPWVKWTDQMILKTALHRLEPYVPTSSNWLLDKLRAVRDVANEPVHYQQPPAVPVDVSHLEEIHPDDPDLTVDAEVVDE